MAERQAREHGGHKRSDHVLAAAENPSIPTTAATSADVLACIKRQRRFDNIRDTIVAEVQQQRKVERCAARPFNYCH